MNGDEYWGFPSDAQSHYHQARKTTRPKNLANKYKRSQLFSDKDDFNVDPRHSAVHNPMDETNIQYSTGPIGYNRPVSGPIDASGFNLNVDRNTVPYYNNPGTSFDAPTFNQGYPGFPTNPLVADMALRYGSNLVDSGKDIVDKELNKYVSVSKIKTYFDVDTSYTSKKLLTIIFPFANQSWIPKNVEGNASPREDFNSPDLYIPLMAYLTYVLLAGLVIAMKIEFRPEVLGILASQALACVLVEVIIELITIYITNLQTHFCTFDLLAFSGYKFIGLIFVVALRWLFDKTGYYVALLYFGVALSFFLIRTLNWRMINESVAYDQQEHGPHSLRVVHQRKRRLYLLSTIALSQPLLMFWLSNYLENQINMAT